MRIQGLNIKGINLPNYKPLIPIVIPYSIKQHKYGAEATWSHCTDQYKPSVNGHAFDAEINGFKYNLALTCFISPVTDNPAGDFTDVSKTGRISFGVYERTAHSFSVDPNLDVEKSIDDHYMNIRDGLGYYPSVASYGYGYYDYQEEFKDYYLGVRNSQWGLTEYSYDIQDTSSFPTTTRQGDMWSDRETNLGHVGQALENAINAGGWYRDFTHWHTVETGELEEYFSQQRSIIGNRNVVTLSFMEAIEYMKLRQSITEIKFFEADGKIYATTEMPHVPVFRRGINTTISVEVDLSGTVLEGEDIKANYGAQKLGNNKFIIEVPIDDYCIIESDSIGQYLDFELPAITGVNRNGTVLTVTTDKPTNVAVFETPLNGQTYQANLRKRSNVMSTNHAIDISDIAYSSRDIYIGAITEAKQSVLSTKYNL